MRSKRCTLHGCLLHRNIQLQRPVDLFNSGSCCPPCANVFSRKSFLSVLVKESAHNVTRAGLIRIHLQMSPIVDAQFRWANRYLEWRHPIDLKRTRKLTVLSTGRHAVDRRAEWDREPSKNGISGFEWWNATSIVHRSLSESALIYIAVNATCTAGRCE